MYGTAPLWGKLVDARGPRILLVIGFVSLLSGYMGIRHFYDAGLPEGVADLSSVAFGALVLCGFATGIGGNGGLASAMNVTAKSWPDRAVSDQSTSIHPVSLLPCNVLGELESNNHRSRPIWVRSLSVPLLHNRTCFLSRRHLRILAPSSYRHFTPNGLGLLLCSPNAASSS